MSTLTAPAYTRLQSVEAQGRVEARATRLDELAIRLAFAREGLHDVNRGKRAMRDGIQRLSLIRAPPASASMLPLIDMISRISSGMIASATSVSVASILIITTNIPPSRISDDSSGKESVHRDRLNRVGVVGDPHHQVADFAPAMKSRATGAADDRTGARATRSPSAGRSRS